MRALLSLSIYLILILSQLVAQSKDIIAYYPSWRFSDRDTLVTQATIPYDKLTIINYAFFYPTPDGELVGLNPAGDAFVLNNLVDPKTGNRIPRTSLVAMAEKHGVKVMLSIGGWEDSDNFPGVAADPAKRLRFAESCVDMIKRYGFHGIDIDWEYPGHAPHNGTPADRENFTLLLKTLRESLHAYGQQTGKYYMISHAISASPVIARGTNFEEITPLLDFFNIMTYDFNGSWNPESNHNSPLFASQVGPETANVAAAFKLYNERYGIPANKLNLGVAFYGRTYKDCDDLFGTHTGASTFFHPEGFADYYMIVEKRFEFHRKWDAQAKVPYLINSDKRIVVSYDDPISVRLKAQFVNEVEARGVIIWQIMGDHLPSGETPLLDVLSKELAVD